MTPTPKHQRPDYNAHMPTPEEIQHRAAQVQANWSEREELKRRVIQPQPSKLHTGHDYRINKTDS